jgi:hypothetical protein
MALALLNSTREAMKRLLWAFVGGGPSALRRAITRALALTPRGFVPRDVLALARLSARLQLEWRARDLHPWDRGLAPERRAQIFREQMLRDTDAAIRRCFRLLPEIDAIDVRVLGPHPPHGLLCAGTVLRRDAFEARSLSSPWMRLNAMGVRVASPA